MARRSDALRTAVLGLLAEEPLHGYELRARLDVLIGALRRRISFGSVYPALRSLELAGLIVASPASPAQPAGPDEPATTLAPRRRRVVYGLTAAGESHLADLLAARDPAAWEDGSFDVRFAFFSRTDAATRLAVLQGRHGRISESLARARQHHRCCGGRADGYRAELARRSAESLERELAWLDDVVVRERRLSPTLGTRHPSDLPPPREPAAASAHRPPPSTSRSTS